MSWNLMEHHPNCQDTVSAENRSQWMLLDKRVCFSWLKEEMCRAWGKVSSGFAPMQVMPNCLLIWLPNRISLANLRFLQGRKCYFKAEPLFHGMVQWSNGLRWKEKAYLHLISNGDWNLYIFSKNTLILLSHSLSLRRIFLKFLSEKVS